MKKIVTLALSALALSLNSSAADWQLYADGAWSSDLAYYYWWQAGTDDKTANPSGDGMVFSLKSADGSGNASCGWMPADGGAYKTGMLADATLEFDWYVEDFADNTFFTIRLTPPDPSNYDVTPTADQKGKWNHASFKVSELMPAVADAWKGGANGYVFSTILSNGTANSTLYIKDVKYTGVNESWTPPTVVLPEAAPTPEPAQEDVISFLGGKYQNVPFNIGGWGQSTQVENVQLGDIKQPAEHLTFFNYLGWEFAEQDASAMKFLHIDLYSETLKEFKVTPICKEGTQEYVYTVDADVPTGKWNSYDIPLSVYTEQGLNMAHCFQIKFEGTPSGNCAAYMTNVYFWNGNTQSGIETVETAGEGEAIYYNLQGVRVANPEAGLFVRVKDGKAEKVLVK